MSHYVENCCRIWEGYKIYARGASVIRRGFELVGASQATDDVLNLNSTFRRRSESILEHQAKVAWLASVFMSNFPNFFSEEITYILPLDTWILFTTCLCHDVGETENGDIPDDGNPLHDTKDGAEFAVFEKYVAAYGYTDGERLLKMYKTFQKRDSYSGKALYSLDKLDAVLTNLVLEENGVYGRISAKIDPTARDLKYAKLVGSDLAADVWGVQMLSRLQGFPPEITEPIKTLLEVASLDVRKQSFSWLER